MNVRSLGATARAAAVLVVLLSAGCASIQKNLTVTLDKSWFYKGDVLPSIEVDLVGVSEQEKHLWETYSMTDYWNPGNRLRTEAVKHVLRFGSGQSTSQTIKRKDAIWADWKSAGTCYLFVLADLPGAYSDVPGSDDPRRKVLDLKKTSANIEVIIRPAK